MKPPLRLPLEAIAPGPRPLPPEAATYVTRVHRLGAGDRILVFDPDLAVEADAEIAGSGRRGSCSRVRLCSRAMSWMAPSPSVALWWVTTTSAAPPSGCATLLTPDGGAAELIRRERPRMM